MIKNYYILQLLYGTAQFKFEACVRVTRVYFVAPLRVFFKIVCVCRQLHKNLACHTRMCDVTKHVRVRTCMHARYNACTFM